MGEKMARRTFLRLMGAAAAVSAAAALTGCGKSTEELLEGDWYEEGGYAYQPDFQIYDDGTCKITGTYGEGKWAIVNKEQLKITNFYGEVYVLDIESVDKDCLQIRRSQSEVVSYYHTREEAAKH